MRNRYVLVCVHVWCPCVDCVFYVDEFFAMLVLRDCASSYVHHTALTKHFACAAIIRYAKLLCRIQIRKDMVTDFRESA